MESRPDCHQITEQIDQMSQGQLHALRDQWSFHLHLWHCPACRGHLEGALELASALDKWQVHRPRTSVVPGVMARIRSDPDLKPRGIGRRARSFEFQVRVAAAVLVVASLILWIVLNTGRPGPLPPSGTTVVPSGPGPQVVLDYGPYLPDPTLVAGTLVIVLGSPPVRPQRGVALPANNHLTL